MSEVDLPQDWCTFKKFREALPSFHTTDDSLRWELRFRDQNGLIENEVVIERYADPNASRPTILISPSRYVHHLRKRAVR